MATSAVQAATQPVLGSPEYLPGGTGFGEATPRVIFNGGSPGGLLNRISWTGWGKPTAVGTGYVAVNRPQGNYYPLVRASLMVSVLGTCPGRSERAYKVLKLRVPQWPGGPLGSWLKWSGTRTICSYDEPDPSYEDGSPGRCDAVGEFGAPDTVQSIAVYRMTCRRAEPIARTLGGLRVAQGCYRQGCRRTINGARCHLHRLVSGETTGTDYPYPLQRVSCRAGKSTFSAFKVLSYD